MTTIAHDLYAGYFDHDGQWQAIAPEWTDIREAPRHRAWRVLDRGEARLAQWGRHPHTQAEGWMSVVDPVLMLDPTHFRDLARPPHAS